MDINALTFKDGFFKQARTIFRQTKQAAEVNPGTAEQIERMLNSAAGRAVHLKHLNPNSAPQRWLSRLLSADGQLWAANNPRSLAPGTHAQNYVSMGATARGRMQAARRIGYGGLGLAGGGAIGYGLGVGHGQNSEDKFLGRAGNRYISNAPLSKRLAIALNTVFRPHETGKEVQNVLT